MYSGGRRAALHTLDVDLLGTQDVWVGSLDPSFAATQRRLPGYSVILGSSEYFTRDRAYFPAKATRLADRQGQLPDTWQTLAVSAVLGSWMAIRGPRLDHRRAG